MSKRIVVLGAGISGVGAAVLAKGKGFDVFVSDKGEITDDNKKVLLNNEIDWEEFEEERKIPRQRLLRRMRFNVNSACHRI